MLLTNVRLPEFPMEVNDGNYVLTDSGVAIDCSHHSTKELEMGQNPHCSPNNAGDLRIGGCGGAPIIEKSLLKLEQLLEWLIE